MSKRYLPARLFDPRYDPDLAQKFAEMRYTFDNYKQKADYQPTQGSNNFNLNAGAVALYDKNKQRIAGPYAQFSQPLYFQSPSHAPLNITFNNPYTSSIPNNFSLPSNQKMFTSFGHSERIGMKDVLNHYMPRFKNSYLSNLKNVGLPGEIPQLIYDYAVGLNAPKDYPLPNNVPLSYNKNYSNPDPASLYAVYDKAKEYKNFLEDNNLTVKMLSERQECSNDQMAGGSCKSFIGAILPKGSSYGYTSVSNNPTDVQKASEELRPAYEEHMKRLQGAQLRGNPQLNLSSQTRSPLQQQIKKEERLRAAEAQKERFNKRQRTSSSPLNSSPFNISSTPLGYSSTLGLIPSSSSLTTSSSPSLPATQSSTLSSQISPSWSQYDFSNIDDLLDLSPPSTSSLNTSSGFTNQPFSSTTSSNTDPMYRKGGGLVKRGSMPHSFGMMSLLRKYS